MENNVEPNQELDPMPDINRTSKWARALKWTAAGVLVIAVLGILIYNFMSSKPKQAKVKEVERVNVMAPFPQVPPPPPPPPPPSPTRIAPTSLSDALGTAGKKELTKDERVRLPGLSFGGSGSASSKVGEVPQPSLPVVDAQGFPVATKEESELAKDLKPTKLDMVSATILPDRDYLLTRGTGFDCDLQEAMDNRMPGALTCIVARDVYSDSGRVILVERGSQLDGEGRSGANARPGQVRIAALFNRIKTTKGVIADLDSLAGDTLGRTGVEGEIDYHFLERFGSAMLVSFFDTTWQIAASRLIPSNGGSTNFIGGGGGSFGGSGKSVVDSILQQQANIPPSIEAWQGARIRVALMRDISFKNVVKLKLRP